MLSIGQVGFGGNAGDINIHRVISYEQESL
jgi:hypothetical protein